MEKELIDLIAEKNFDQLNTTDRAALGDWCTSEEEFQQMKDLFFGLEVLKNEARIEPRQETKKSLDDIFAATHADPKTILWYNTVWFIVYPKEKIFIRRPLIQMAAALVLLVLISPLFFQTEIISNKAQYAKNEIKKDAEPNTDVILTNEPTNEVQKSAKKVHIDSKVQNEPVFAAQDELIVSREIIEDEKLAEITIFAGAAPSVVAGSSFDHPDGIFKGNNAIAFSQTTKDQPGFLDLLTATF